MVALWNPAWNLGLLGARHLLWRPLLSIFLLLFWGATPASAPGSVCGGPSWQAWGNDIECLGLSRVSHSLPCSNNSDPSYSHFVKPPHLTICKGSCVAVYFAMKCSGLPLLSILPTRFKFPRVSFPGALPCTCGWSVRWNATSSVGLPGPWQLKNSLSAFHFCRPS